MELALSITEEFNFELAAQGFYYALSAPKQAIVAQYLRNAVQLIESGNRHKAYPIQVAGEKVYVLRADDFLRLIVRKAGDTIQLLDIIDKRQAEGYLTQAA